jgi:hypothetical protein
MEAGTGVTVCFSEISVECCRVRQATCAVGRCVRGSVWTPLANFSARAATGGTVFVARSGYLH